MEEIGRLIARDERYAIDFRIIHADGKPRWIRSVASLVSGAGAGPRAIGCITDITALVGSWSPPRANGTAGIKARGRRVRTRRKKPGMNLRPVSLSDHEIECLRWVSLGKTAKETAVILGKSARTVEFHLNNAMRKLNAVNKVQAVFLAVGLNLL
jgi:DNA-binding CsgD family transcriptional regulator